MAEPYSGLTRQQISMRHAKPEEVERLLAAEEVCWGILNTMALVGIDLSNQENREQFLKYISFEKWLDLAVSTGILPGEEDDE